MTNPISLSAGTYYVGDLCYIFDDDSDDWDTACEHVGKKFTLHGGREGVCFFTRYGDGDYKDGQGMSYYVDSGTIGCVKIKESQIGAFGFTGGNYVNFPEEFTCTNEHGLLTFGHIVIDTRD